MIALAPETTPVYRVEYHQVESWIRDNLIPDYNFLLETEVSNDSDLSVLVTKNKQPRRHWRERHVGALLDQLCVNEVIPEGRYLISVCW